MAGNALEWTMEAYGTDKRVLRGGSHWDNGKKYPASSRWVSEPTDGNYEYGFRIALYINE